MAVILDGKALSEKRMGELKERVDAMKAKGKTIGLSVILVGDNPASQVYVRNKGKACEALGIPHLQLLVLCGYNDASQYHFSGLLSVREERLSVCRAVSRCKVQSNMARRASGNDCRYAAQNRSEHPLPADTKGISFPP